MNDDQSLVSAFDDYHARPYDQIRQQRQHRDIQSYPDVLVAD